MSQCPIQGCTDQARPGQLMCPAHWRLVPSELKKQVYQTWRAFIHGKTVEARLDARRPYLEAKQLAVATVNSNESPLL